MDKVYPLIEMGATYIENLIILMAVITISGQKFKGMRLCTLSCILFAHILCYCYRYE